MKRIAKPRCGNEENRKTQMGFHGVGKSNCGSLTFSSHYRRRKQSPAWKKQSIEW
ncbi:hypothetical protein U1Q18_013782, partial [Sarracenia purpurea var. burkii]